MTHSDDLELLEAVLRGEEKAGDRFAERFASVIRSSAAAALRRYTGAASESALDDVMQDVFLKLWEDGNRRLRAFDPGRASLATYLGVVAYRRAAGWLREKGGEKQAGDAVESLSTLAPSDEEAVEVDLKGAAAGLPPRERAVFLLRFEQGLSYKQIADLSGMTSGAVGAFIARARKRLRHKDF